MTQYIIQMSGVPGSGKSTVACGIADGIDAIVLDHDDTKSAIMSPSIANDLAGQASYSVIKVLSRRIAGQGFSVIIDSPCFYTGLLEHGRSIAREFGAQYRYIECCLYNWEELANRLHDRKAKPSQVKTLDGVISHQGRPPLEAREVFNTWLEKTKRPECGYLQIDSANAPEDCINEALAYVLSCT